MATQETTLYGGPWHGRQIALQAGINHFHIAKPMGEPTFDELITPTPLDLTRGTYSRVGTSKTEFEWDGWKQ